MRLRSRRHASLRAARRHARDLAIGLAVMLAAGTGDAAPTGGTPMRNAHIVEHAPPRPLVVTDATQAPAAPTTTSSSKTTSSSWAASLPTIEVKNRNTNATAKLRLYDDRGAIDRTALHTFMQVARGRAAAGEPARANEKETSVANAPDEPLEPRLVQLVFRAAYHFKSTSMVIVSATRRGAHGKHGSGAALDFQLGNVNAATLAAYVRSFPRAGVGIYTHPKTQYVHVDVRDHSYHWLDGSPPGVTWREKLLGDPTQQKRDASYATSMDMPEQANN